LLVKDSVIGCDDTTVTLVTPTQIPAVKDDASRRTRRRYEVLSDALAKDRPGLTARMWAYRGVTVPINVFDFTVSREPYGPDEVLSEFRGFLLADCWSGFQQIHLRSDARITRAACAAHARRKVQECRSSHPQQASVLLAMFRQLYDIENRGKELSPEDRRTLRQVESVAVLKRMRDYLDNHWQQLNLFTTEGHIPIDDNDVEQLMRQVATGRKNWLFLGSPDAGDRAATLLTLISTALRHDLDVWAYLKDALDQLLAGSTDYHSLRPDIWKLSHPQFVRTYRTEERRDTVNRTRLTRAQRRLANAKKQNAR
jgi:hypothetical protein